MKCPKCQVENPSDSKFCKECATPLPPPREIHSEVTETLQTPVKELTTGTTFASRYQVIEELGKGGMGKVYKVLDTKIKEKVALKLIKPEIAADRETLERFRNELKFARRIRQKNVCQMFDLGEAEGTHYITMEYVRGEDLKRLIRMSGQLGVGTAVSIARQVCEGLTEAHAKGVIHRDLKPQNIMLDEEGTVRIMDFGIARSLKEKGITGASVMIGTPEYMSPEQAEANEVDERSDLYSLGVILYEMVTGRVPFEGDTALSIAMKHKSEVPKSPRQLNPNIPDELSRIILKCLDKEKAGRYQSASELCSELEKIEKGIPLAELEIPKGKPITSREITVKFTLRKLVIPLGLAILMAVAGWIGWKFLKKSGILQASPEKHSIAVLPFQDLSLNKDQDYFCDGMADEIITDLSRVSGLRVISRSSAMSYKGSRKNVKTIGQELKVRYILEGSVRKADEDLRVSAQLIDARSDAQVWAESYERTLEDVFAIQEELSQSIVEALRLKLTPEEKKRITERPITNLYAYECYLRARKDIYLYSKPALDKAESEIRNALATIGDNALLYSSLGLIYFQYVNIGFNRDEYLKKAEETLDKIFLLEPDSPYGHKLMGFIQFRKRQAKQAAKNFNKALSVDPNDPDSLAWLGYIYAQAGQIHSAKKFSLKSTQVDPVMFPIGNELYIELMNGQFKSALESLVWHLNNPSPGLPFEKLRCLEIVVLAFNKRYEDVDKKVELFIKDFGGPEKNYYASMFLSLKHGLHGEKNKALASITEDLKTYCRQDELWSWFLANCYALAGAKEEALDFLEIAVNRGFVNYPFIAKHNPFFESLRGEERFKELLKRVKREWQDFEKQE